MKERLPQFERRFFGRLGYVTSSRTVEGDELAEGLREELCEF